MSIIIPGHIKCDDCDQIADIEIKLENGEQGIPVFEWIHPEGWTSEVRFYVGGKYQYCPIHMR